MVILLGQRYVVGLSDAKSDLAPIFKDLTSSVDKTNRDVLGTHGTQSKQNQSHGHQDVCSWAYVQMGTKSSAQD